MPTGTPESSSYVAVIPTRISGLNPAVFESIILQTVPPQRVVVQSVRLPESLPIGIRVGRTINMALEDLDLTEYAYLLRVDNDWLLPANFMEENLKLNADVVGFSGCAQLIRMQPFRKHFKGRYPEIEINEDTYVQASFLALGLKARPWRVEPIALSPAGETRNKVYWVAMGRGWYRMGCVFWRLVLRLIRRFARPKWKSGHEWSRAAVLYTLAGFLIACIRRERKHWFAPWLHSIQNRPILLRRLNLP